LCEHQIRDERDFVQHIDYIHFNPVKHGFVSRPADWRFSNIYRYIRQGILPTEWVFRLWAWMMVLGGNKSFVGLRTACNPTYSTL
jgi:hypothetical protein